MEKYVIVFGRAKDHTDSEATNFVRASKSTVQRVCNDWYTSGDHEAQRQNCAKNIL